MLVRLIFAAVLLAGCAAPVIQPSLSHSPGCYPDIQTPQPGQRELSHDELVSRTPDYVDFHGIDTLDWSWTDQLPNSRTGCIVGLVIVVALIIATTTVWR